VRDRTIIGRRPVRALLAAALLGLAVALGSPGTAAFADGTLGGFDTSDDSANGHAVVHRCVLYANASGFGADCAGGDPTKTVKEILGDDPFAECRDEPITSDDSPPSTHDGEKGAWYLETCLRGIKPDGTGDFTRTTELVWFPAGTPVPVLTQNQNNAWRVYRSRYPSPKAQFGPATAPRVLIPTFFWLTNDTGDTITRTVFDGVRDMDMRARVEQIEVSPGVDEHEKSISCKAPLLRYDYNLGIFNQPSTCSYDYQRSSASKPDHIYEVIVQADWVVEYQTADGRWIRLGAIPLSQITKTPVDEIQTVVG
jgi:hypothetical protein